MPNPPFEASLRVTEKLKKLLATGFSSSFSRLHFRQWEKPTPPIVAFALFYYWKDDAWIENSVFVQGRQVTTATTKMHSRGETAFFTI
jgi:hypothetical protein